MAAMQTIDVDTIWIELGTWGKFQVRQLVMYMFLCVSWALPMLSIVVVGNRPSYECRPPGPNDTVRNDSSIRREYGECNIKTFTNISGHVVETETGCTHGWIYGEPQESSFATQWDLVCGHAEMAELTQALFVAGQMVGALLLPPLSDRYGRKLIMTLSHIALFAVSLGTAFTPTYTTFTITRILAGIVMPGLLAGSTLVLENFPTHVRAYTEAIAILAWTSGIAVMSPISYLLRNFSWRYLQITFGLMSSWSLIQWWLADESVRWLVLNNRLEEAKAIIKRACKINKKDYVEVLTKSGFKDVELETVNANQQDQDTSSPHDNKLENGEDKTLDVALINKELKVVAEQGAKYTILAIFKERQILKVSIIIWWLWIVDSMVYFGLYMISSELAGNRFVNFFLSAVCEYPVALAEYFLIYRIGRKKLLMLMQIFAVVCLVVASALIHNADGNNAMLVTATVFIIVGKMGMTGAMSCLFVFTPELYPTNLRTSAYGLASFFGKVGMMISPFARNLAEKALWAPGAIFAGMVCSASIFLFFVPETRGVELPQTIEELKEWYSVNTTSCFKKKEKEKSDKFNGKRELEGN